MTDAVNARSEHRHDHSKNTPNTSFRSDRENRNQSDKESQTTILALYQLAKKHRVTMVTAVEDAIVVHLSGREIKFKPLPNGLYAINPLQKNYVTSTEPESNQLIEPKPNQSKSNKSNQSINSQVQMITTLEENKTFYTDRQFERAKRARDMFHALGAPSVQNVKAAISMGLIKNCPVTVKDVDLVARIFGPDIGIIKGKTTRRKPKPVVDNHISIPSEILDIHRDVTLAIDGLKTNTVKFLSSIGLKVKYRSMHYLPKSNAKFIQRAVLQAFAPYRLGN